VSLLRRGFKTWCENAAIGYRRDLNIDRDGTLDPRLLAQHLGVKVWTAKEVSGLAPATLKQLTEVDPQSWSAVTLRSDKGDLVILNNAHVSGRQNNSLAHELSHIILEHEPAQVFVTQDGMMMMTDYNKTHEEEANWLAGTLLVPREALAKLLANGHDNRRAAQFFQVTIDVIQMRRNLTGIDLQFARRRKRIGA
jgi:hypothetical protein